MTSPPPPQINYRPQSKSLSGARGRRQQRPQGAANSQNDKRIAHAHTEPLFPTMYSSRHMQLYRHRSIAELYTNPLDPLWVKFQVLTLGPEAISGAESGLHCATYSISLLDVDIDQNASHAGRNVHEPAKTLVTPKAEQSAHFLLGGSTPLVADTEQPPKATPGRCLELNIIVVSLNHATAQRHILFKKGKGTADTGVCVWLQPFKVLHDMVPHSASFAETFICVFSCCLDVRKPPGMGLHAYPSVVLLQALDDGFHPQHDDNVVFFEVLRGNLERVKAGALNARSSFPAPYISHPSTCDTIPPKSEVELS
ncbi:hypothetical protein V8E53_007956 [Lactarius tabidus]